MIWLFATAGCLLIFILGMGVRQKQIQKLLTLFLMAALLFGYQWALNATRWYDYHQFLQSTSLNENSKQLKYALMKNHLLKLYRQDGKQTHLLKLVPICRQLKDYECVKNKLIYLLQNDIKPAQYALRLVEAEYHLGEERPSAQLTKALAVCQHHAADQLECQSFSARAHYNAGSYEKAASLWKAILDQADKSDPRLAIWKKSYHATLNAGVNTSN